MCKEFEPFSINTPGDGEPGKSAAQASPDQQENLIEAYDTDTDDNDYEDKYYSGLYDCD